MRLSAVDCIHRGIVNLRANWELIFFQWLQVLVVGVLVIGGFAPPLAVVGVGLSQLMDVATGDWGNLVVGASDWLEGSRDGRLLIAVSLLFSSAIWLVAALVYCFFQGGIFGVLMAGDRQAPAGAPRQWQWFRAFSARDLRGWASRYLWRYFWLMNLFVAISVLWLPLPLLLVGLVIWGSERWGGSAAVGIGCGGAIPVLFSLLVIAFWSNLAKADLARQESSVWGATAIGLRLVGRRLGAVIVLFVTAAVVGMVAGVGASVVSFVVEMLVGGSHTVRLGSQLVLSLLQWLVSSAVAVAFAATLVGLVRSESEVAA